MTRKLRLGWVSTYNARCGIAAHSEHLLEHFDEDAYEITILADDQDTVAPDPDDIVRLWRKNAGGLPRVTDYLITNRFDIALFQYNFSFFDLSDFADSLTNIIQAGIVTFVMFHRTSGLEEYRQRASYERIRAALQGCARLFVHSLEDVDRLREFGIAENVVLLAHGVIDRPPINKDAARGLLGLSGHGPVIGSFGFLLPGKGLPELIHAFALLLRTYPDAYLLMLNADYPTPESGEERDRCRALICELDLEHHVRLMHDFLSTSEILFLLSACDAVVYPYQRSEESASGAVRLALAAGRPVLTTPLPTFADLSDIVYKLPGTEARAIADGIIACLKDDEEHTRLLKRQRDWIKANSWAAQAARISNIILSSFEEIHRVELRPAREHVRVSAGAAGHTPAASRPIRHAELAAAQAFLERQATKWQANAPAVNHRGSGASRTPSLVEPAISPRCEGLEADFTALADKARDSRDWPVAARYYRQELEERPANPAIWVQYGHALKESGNRAEAENAYRKSLELDPDVPDTHLQLGHVLKIQGKRSEASTAYLRALALDPELEDAAFELRRLGWSDGRIELALREERRRSK